MRLCTNLVPSKNLIHSFVPCREIVGVQQCPKEIPGRRSATVSVSLYGGFRLSLEKGGEPGEATAYDLEDALEMTEKGGAVWEADSLLHILLPFSGARGALLSFFWGRAFSPEEVKASSLSDPLMMKILDLTLVPAKNSSGNGEVSIALGNEQNPVVNPQELSGSINPADKTELLIKKMKGANSMPPLRCKHGWDFIMSESYQRPVDTGKPYASGSPNASQARL